MKHPLLSRLAVLLTAAALLVAAAGCQKKPAKTPGEDGASGSAAGSSAGAGGASGSAAGSDGKGLGAEDIGWKNQAYVLDAVRFDFDKYDIRSDAAAQLERHAKWLRENPTVRVTIEGHACNIGTENYNLALGQKRAEAVRNFLVSAGVTPGRLQVISYGMSRPAYSNDTEETRQLNRRAEFVVK